MPSVCFFRTKITVQIPPLYKPSLSCQYAVRTFCCEQIKTSAHPIHQFHGTDIQLFEKIGTELVGDKITPALHSFFVESSVERGTDGVRDCDDCERVQDQGWDVTDRKM